MKKFIFLIISMILLTSCMSTVRENDCCVVTGMSKISNQYRYTIKVYDGDHYTRNFFCVHSNDVIYAVGDTVTFKKVEK